MRWAPLGAFVVLLLASVTTAFQPYAPSSSRRPTRQAFKIPADEVPVVETLDPKSNFTVSGAEPLQDKNVFRMPWLSPVAPPRRGWMENAIIKTAAEDSTDAVDAKDVAEAKEAAKELQEIELLERQLGLGEEGPVLFVQELGSTGANVSWLQRPTEDVLAPPAKEDRVFRYKAPGWAAIVGAGFRRRLSPFPLFTKSVPHGCVLVASIKGEDLSLVTDDGPPSLTKLFQEPPIGWLEPVSPFVKAAHDPRVKAVIVKIGPLSCGYAKLVELRRSMDYFKQSGKQLIGGWWVHNSIITRKHRQSVH